MRTTPVGQAQPGVVVRAYCFNTDLPGHAVRVLGPRVGGLYQVTKVDIGSADPVESVAIGVIASKLSTSTCLVALSGPLVGIYTGLPFGRMLFVGLDSYLSVTPPPRPTTGGRMLQSVARSIAADVIMVNPGPPTRIVAA